MVSIYSFGRPLSLPDIDEDLDDEDVGIYLETACFKCQQYAKKSEALTEKVENLQTLLSHREHHLKVSNYPYDLVPKWIKRVTQNTTQNLAYFWSFYAKAMKYFRIG